MDWISQVPIFCFNSGKYDLNMVKYYVVKNISNLSNVKVAKKDNLHMFLITPSLSSWMSEITLHLVLVMTAGAKQMDT